jgi:putative ABC transport system permease protein
VGDRDGFDGVGVANPVPMLVSLKAVDPAEYPFYGTAELEPAMPLRQAFQGDSALWRMSFLFRLNAHVGDTLRLGGRTSPSLRSLKQEPDRISETMGWGRAS